MRKKKKSKNSIVITDESIQHIAIQNYLILNASAYIEDLDLALAQRASTSMWTMDYESKPILNGDRCTALYNADGMWYDANVVKVLSRNRYKIVFDGYTNSEIVHQDNIQRIPTENETSSLELKDQRKRDQAINYVPIGNKTTLLHYFSEHGYDHIVNWLLNNNADTLLFDRSGFTALHRAAANGHLTIVGLLLDYGAQWRARTKLTKQSVYDVAKYNNHYNVVTYLEDKTNGQRDIEIEKNRVKVWNDKVIAWKKEKARELEKENVVSN